jgi:uncharacterized repeat protein (TIGR03803 family)
MRNKKLSIGLTVVLAIFAVALLVIGTPAAAQHEKVLHNYSVNSPYPKGGSVPLAGLVADGAGNLYGTTFNGGSGACSLDGSVGCGVVFELTPTVGGGWTEKVLHNFNNTGTDGYHPLGGLIFDAAGNLYGTTNSGGNTTGCSIQSGSGCGTVFELTPRSGGGWAERILHNFNDNGTDGYQPAVTLIFDGAGNLYGTTVQGGANNLGTVFELTPGGGGWTETILYSFNSTGKNGYNPLSSVTFDGAGNLYGTTFYGGEGLGTVYELTPTSGGWTEKVLHRFVNNSKGVGGSPYSGVIFDGAGNLYGGTGQGFFYGTVYELMPTSGGGWTEKVLHLFSATGPTSLTFDSAGNLYGTLFRGGAGSGAIFELTLAGGSWTEKVLHNFTGNNDGGGPNAALVIDAAGNLYGTTEAGGRELGGTVFEITP